MDNILKTSSYYNNNMYFRSGFWIGFGTALIVYGTILSFISFFAIYHRTIKQ